MKRFVPAALLLLAVGCETSPPTGSEPPQEAQGIDPTSLRPYVDVPASTNPADPKGPSLVASANGSNVLVFGDRFEKDQLETVLTGLGHTVTKVTTLPADLSPFQTVWHVGAFVALTSSEQDRLAAFLGDGGGVYLTGERPCCETLNASLQTLINSVVVGGGIALGGLGDFAGSFTFNPGAADGITTTPNTLVAWSPASPGGMAGVAASNTLVTHDATGTPNGAVWTSSDLAGGDGRLAILMDVNWLTSSAASRDPVIENIQTFLEEGDGSTSRERVPAGKAATVTVEEPCTAELDGQCARAGADIKEGTFNDDVDFTVAFRQVPPGTCHGTLFGQTGRCLEVTAKIATGPNAGQDAQLQKPITIIACPPGDNKEGLDFFKFEDAQGTPVALKEVDEDISNCDGFLATAAESSWLKRFAMGVVKRAGRLLGPEPLQAALFNRGVGHDTPDGDRTLSHFTWASEIQISTASLAVNVKNSGKDAFSVAGVFGLAAPLSSASPPPPMTVSFGDGGAALNAGGDDVVQTLSATVCPTLSSRGCWRLSFGHWVWSAPFGTATGILTMSIRADGSGEFSVGGAVPNTGLVRGTPTFRAFSLEIGTRTQGTGLECAADGKCTVHD